MILTQHKYNHLARVPPNQMRQASDYFRVKSTRTCRHLKDYRKVCNLFWRNILEKKTRE